MVGKSLEENNIKFERKRKLFHDLNENFEKLEKLSKNAFFSCSIQRDGAYLMYAVQKLDEDWCETG